MTFDHERIGRAVARAGEWHATQVRKGTETPYLSHLMGVASLVIEDGGDEDQVIAGLLHDAAEDQGGEAMLGVIAAEFGERVAAMVRSCSDSLTEDPEAKAPWRERKEAAIAHLAQCADDVLLVVAADKLHNLRSTITDAEVDGAADWSKFKAGRDGFFWYNATLHDLLARRLPGSRSVRAFGVELEQVREQP